LLEAAAKIIEFNFYWQKFPETFLASRWRAPKNWQKPPFSPKK
jgi:hypothetical protein